MGGAPVVRTGIRRLISRRRVTYAGRMRTWELDLTYRRGQLDGERMRAPRGTQVREMGIELLGEHVTAAGAHDSEVKPRALYFRAPGPGHGGVLRVTWLSDVWAPLRTPPRVGQLNWGNGASVVDFVVERAPVTVTGAALWHFFAGGSDERWTTCRFRTESGVLFKREHTGYVSAAQIFGALANRWELLNTWSPPTEAELPDPALVPAEVLAELVATTSVTAVRHCGPVTPHQVATKHQRVVPAIKEVPLAFDLDVHCAAADPVVLVWFRVLCAFAEIAAIGRYTPTGLGAVRTSPVG
ncbi:hypothetical protein [Nocardia thailandica]